MAFSYGYSFGYTPPLELELPRTRLNPEKQDSYNNHHLEFTERAMGRFVITRLLRDLSGMQIILPVDVHDHLHDIYAPPELPDIYQAFMRVGEAFESGEVLRLGSAHRPRYKAITADIFKKAEEEYKRLR